MSRPLIYRCSECGRVSTAPTVANHYSARDCEGTVEPGIFVRLLSFDEALAVQVAAAAAMDESRRRRLDRSPAPELVAAFHDACLDVRRAIHRDFPTLYGDPDAEV